MIHSVECILTLQLELWGSIIMIMCGFDCEATLCCDLLPYQSHKQSDFVFTKPGFTFLFDSDC